MTEKHIILASQSPRRRDLLQQIGITFSQIDANANEEDITSKLNGHPPSCIAQTLSREKALSAKLTAGDNAIIISADTIVVLDDQVLGKPKNEEDAARMLSMLSGRTHHVITGVTLLDTSSGKTLTQSSITEVVFAKLSQREIEDYVKTKEPLDKAGAYGIQGKAAAFIKRINGCYFNVVGLPLSQLKEMLAEFGVYI